MNALKACPFCGGAARTVLNSDDIETWAQCTTKKPRRCPMSHTIIPIEEWNRRTQPEATAPAQDLSGAIDKDAKIAAQRARIMELEHQLAVALNTPINDWCPECHARESSGDALSAGDRVDAALLQKLRDYVGAKSQEYGYGFYRPANPHDFTPDADQCSEDEIAAHKAACEAFDKGEYTHDHSGCIQGGGMHILHAPWGIGSYVMRDEESVALLAAIDAAILQSQKGGSHG